MRTERRKGIEIMMRLIGLVKPMLPIMIIAITGDIGIYVCNINNCHGGLCFYFQSVFLKLFGGQDICTSYFYGSYEGSIALRRAVLQPFYRL